MIGAALSHYRITAAIGAGGMGEAYRARDTRLDRDAAIKVLPAKRLMRLGLRLNPWARTGGKRPQLREERPLLVRPSAIDGPWSCWARSDEQTVQLAGGW